MKSLLMLLLVTVISCGNDDNSSPDEKKVQPVCGNSTNAVFSKMCLPTSDWTIKANRTDFPAKISLKVNDSEVLNECNANPYPKFTVSRDSLGAVIESKNVFLPVGPTFTVEVTDLGADCLQNNSYYLNTFEGYDEVGRNDVIDLVIE